MNVRSEGVQDRALEASELLTTMQARYEMLRREGVDRAPMGKTAGALGFSRPWSCEAPSALEGEEMWVLRSTVAWCIGRRTGRLAPVGSRRWLSGPGEDVLVRRTGEISGVLGPPLIPLMEGIRCNATAVEAPARILATLHGLVVGGVGEYRRVSNDRRYKGSIWSAGEGTGLLHGVLPTFVSGSFAGLQAATVLDG